MSKNHDNEHSESADLHLEIKRKLLHEYAELPPVIAYFMSAYTELPKGEASPGIAPDTDGDLVHNYGLCMALANPVPLGVHFHESISRSDAVRLLRKMADRIEGDPTLLTASSSDEERQAFH